MPTGPSTRMRSFAARWLTDRVTVSDVSFATDTRPISGATETETGIDRGVPALVRQSAVQLVDGQTVRRDVRDLTVWVDDSCVTPTAGQRVTITTCSDSTLVGAFGEIISVERDSLRAARRCQVRLGNNA